MYHYVCIYLVLLPISTLLSLSIIVERLSLLLKRGVWQDVTLFVFTLPDMQTNHDTDARKSAVSVSCYG